MWGKFNLLYVCNSTVQLVVGRINYGELWRDSQGRKSRNLFEIKSSYRHFKMFLVISTASEDRTDENSYLCTTPLLLLLWILLWRHSILPKYGRWSSFDSQRSQRNKTQIVKNYLSRLLGSVIVNFETLPHIFLPSYPRPPLP